MVNEREENNKMELFVISPHLISSIKETPEAFGKIILKHSPGPKSRIYVPPGSVFSLPPPPCALISISLDHVRLAQNLSLQKLPCELTVLIVGCAPRAKM